MTESRRERLLAAAEELKLAIPEDFIGGVMPDDGADYRVIANTQLRAQLISAGFAEGIQSPKGPQKIASIIKIYPNGDGPGFTPRGQRTICAVARVSRGSRRGKQQLPTVDELRALLTRIDAVEGHIAREVSMTIDSEIETLKQRVAAVGLDVLPGVLAEINAAVAKRADVHAFARPEAMKKIAQDREFAPRVYLSMIQA